MTLSVLLLQKEPDYTTLL